ncbi:Pentatricopeptide repeat-containing protein, partial [Actinidia chinensis var. chinensis]
MLRAKHLGTLSQSARFFFLSGSRCNAADGSSCTCTEDENCILRRQQTRNEVRPAQTAPAIVPKTSARVGSLMSGDAVKVVNSHKAASVEYPAPRPEVVSATTSLARTDSVNYASGIDAVQSDTVYPSPPMSDQFVKAGIAAVSFLSDLVNYKIPMSDGSGMLISLPQNYVVDRTRPLSNIKSSNVKTFRKDKVPGKSFVEAETGPIPTVNSHGAKGTVGKSGLVNGFNTVSNNGARNSVDTYEVTSDSLGWKKNVPYRSKGHANHFMSIVQTSEGKFGDNIAAGLNKLPRETKIPTGVSPLTRQFASNGRVVETVSHILRQLKWGPATQETLGKLNCSMDAYQGNQVLKQLQDHSVALSFFYWLKRQAGFKHDGHTYTTMIGILGRARQFGAINKLLDQMIRDGCQPNVVTYNRIIHSYGRANYLNEAVNVFKQMQESGCEPDRVTYCTLIDIHAKA